MSSWDALYFRLRANYDMFHSVFVHSPPEVVPLQGENADSARSRARYEVGKQVTSVKETATGALLVKYRNVRAGDKEEEIIADMVLGADGPNSMIRKTFLQEIAPRREYSGYVAWRGVVAENKVSKHVKDMFQANITYSIMEDGSGHVIV
jgi:2-polyprenyl-6-methoxyphenol hydroxylase-like FAD-dependent oxidoreductase